jgi:5'-methylthioadenosine phosphorylase
MTLGIIGGTGLDQLGQQGWEEVAADTPFGSVTAWAGEMGGKQALFLPRHGRDHSLPPHRVNYRANVLALQVLGCKRIIAFNAVGGIDPSLPVGAICLPAQFLDFTRVRPRTLYEPPGEAVVHRDMTEPYCPELREKLRQAGEALGFGPLREVVYVCTEGPRFETAAEIRMFGLLGAEVVGMTGVPEVVFAREAGMCYASVCLVTNPGAGLVPDHKLTGAEVAELMEARREDLLRLLEATARRLGEESACGCGVCS